MTIARDIAKAIGASVAAGNIGSDGAIAGGGGSGGVDSASTIALIDRAYVQARQTSGVDSAGTLTLVGIDGVVREHPRNVTSNITIDSAYNAIAAGPLTIDSGYSITINDSATLVIV